MSHRDTTQFQGVALCAEPFCEAITDVINTKKGAVIDNVLMQRGGEEIRLCLLCFLSFRQRYEAAGFKYIQTDKVKA